MFTAVFGLKADTRTKDITDGRVFPHWFAPGATVTGPAYLRLLKEDFWPQVRGEVGRQGPWFEQDGAVVHITAAVRQCSGWMITLTDE